MHLRDARRLLYAGTAWLQDKAGRRRWLRGVGLALGLAATAGGAALWSQIAAQTPPPAGNGTLPGMRFYDAELLSPTQARASYYDAAPATATYGWATEKPWEIQATADALENDPEKIFAFVKNHVRYEPRFGTQKGALGALFDRSGTAFDQAQLLVELLREAGYTAKYQVGTLTLSGAQFTDWLGITSPAVASQFLANGGIPAVVTASGATIAEVQMGHVYVLVNINGSDVALDPSYKVMDRWAQIDVATEAGLSSSGFVSTATTPTGSGTESGVAYIKGVNLTGAESQLNAAAQQLLTKLRTTYKDSRSEEITGGEQIRLYDDAWADKTIGTWSAWSTHTGGMPDKYRTTLAVAVWACQYTYFVDEIYGKRLVYHTPDVYEAGGAEYEVQSVGQHGFSLNEKPMPGASPAVSPECFNPTVAGFRITANLPYAARAPGSSTYGTWMDRLSVKEVDSGADVVVVHGWGDTGAELQARLADDVIEKDLARNSAFTGWPKTVGEYYGPPVGHEPSQSQKVKAKLYASWLAQMTRATDILEGVSNTLVQHHYTIGVAYTQQQRQVRDHNDNNQHDVGEAVLGGSLVDEALRIDIDSGFSTTSIAGSAADKLATRHTIAAFGAMLEGNIFEQQMDALDTASTAQRFPWGQENLTSTMRFHRLLPGGSSVAQYRGGVTSPYGSTCAGQATANQAYTVIQGNDRLVGPGSNEVPQGAFTGSYPHEHRAPQGDNFMHRGCAWVAFNGDGSEIAHVVTSIDRALKGGGGPSGLDLARRTAPMQGDLLKDTFADRSNLEGVDLRTGAFTYRPAPDLVVGQGEFPYSLSFQRVFQAGPEQCPKCAAPGWTHNLDIRARYSGGGLEGMGRTTPLALAAPMVAIKATFEVYKADAAATANQVAALGVMRWLTKHLSGNIVTVNQGAASETFVRLADGTLAAPPGSQSTLTQTGQRRIVDMGAYGRSPIWLYDQISLTLKSGAGDQIAFGWREWNPHGVEGPGVGNDFNNVMGHAQGFFATTWTFPQGVTLTFTYCDDPNVIYGGEPGIPQITSYFYACGDRLERVSSNLGIWIDVDALNATASDGRSTAIGYAYGLGPAFDHTDFHREFSVNPIYVSGFVDAVGKAWAYRWDYSQASTGRLAPHARLLKVTEPEKTTAQFELAYDALGRVRTWRDADSISQGGSGPIFTYHAPGMGSGAREDPLGGFVRIEYDGDDRAIGQYDEMGRLTRTEYDGRGRVAARTTPFGDRTEFTYDDRNNVTEKTHRPSPTVCPLGFSDPWWCQTTVARAVYHATWNKPVQVILPATEDDPEERTWDYDYNAQGLVTQAQAPEVFDGAGGINARPTWALTYDTYGRPLTMTEPTGRRITTVYGGGGQAAFCRSSVIEASQAGGLSLTSNFTCDAAGNETSATDPRGNTSTTTFDALRRKTEGIGPAATNIKTQWVYDPAGRVLQEKRWDATAALWRETATAYSLAGRVLTVTDPAGDIGRTCYDAVGREATKIDPEGRAMKTSYNLAGEPTLIERWWRADVTSATCALTAELPTGQTTHAWRSYTYAPTGVVSSEIDARGNATTFQYDGLSRKIVTTFPDPDGAGPLTAPDESTLTDERGQLVYTRHRSQAGDVRWTKTFFDAAGRVDHLWEYKEGEAWPKGRVTRFSYDLAGRKVWNDVSQQTTQGSFSNSLLTDRRTYGYDAAGRVNQDLWAPEYGVSPNSTLLLAYGYDAAGNRTTLTWPGSWTATYSYDAANRMSGVSFTGGSATFATDSLSHTTNLTRSNGSSTAFTYEADSDLAGLTHAFVSGAPSSAPIAYHRDKAGLVLYRDNPAQYDWAPTLAYAKTYGAANALNQLASAAGTALAFDVRGNMTSDGTHTFTYDQRNRMVSAVKAGMTAAYAYDGDDRRTKKTVNGVITRTLWSGDAEVADTAFLGAILRRYVPGPSVDTPLAVVTSAGAVIWLHADGQGSIVNTSTSAGAAGTPVTYSPHGEIGGSGALPTNVPFGYAGRWHDAETGLWYYRARYYNPKLGQFLQTDPIGTKDDPNLYLYVGADPVNKSDPTGRYGIISCAGRLSCAAASAALQAEDEGGGGAAPSQQSDQTQQRPPSLPVATAPGNRAVITSDYGPRNLATGSKNHNGVDFRARKGAQILSTQDGTVSLAGEMPKGGNSILISNTDGSMSGYAHTAPLPGIEVGVTVTQGQAIGVSDGSGTENAHLHYTFRPGSPGSRATIKSPTANPLSTQFKSNTDWCKKGVNC